MRPSEVPPAEGPPAFPTFPLPPGDNDSSTPGRQYPAGNGLQYAAAAQTSSSAAPVFVQEAHTRREEYANEAIQATAEHWVQEQARRETRKQAARMESDFVLGAAVGEEREASEGSLEFVTGPPRFVGRVILLLAVGLFGAIPLMSPFALTVLLTGCVVTYAADFAGYRRGCVLAIIGTTGLFGVALFLSNLHASISSVGPLCMILSLLGLLLMAAMAAFLHFHWMQLYFPELICLMERCVLGVTPILTLPSLLSTITALVGSRHAPAWFMVAMCVLHRYFYGPLESSFLMRRRLVRGERETDGACEEEPTEEVKSLQANGRAEAITFTLLLVSLPSLLYIFFQSNFIDAWLPNTLNAFGMICGPVAYLCFDPKRSLWFLLPERQTLHHRIGCDPLGVHETVEKYRNPFLILSVAVGLHWAIYRVLHSRYRFLFNGMPPPFNAVCLTFAMYLGLYAAYAVKILLDADKQGKDTRSTRYMGQRVASVVAAALSCIFLAVSAGVPGIFLILMVLCVSSVNIFLLDRANTGPMLSFTVFSSLLLLWWMYRMFSFIVVDLHVLGESTTVPTPLVAMSVLWCYVLSCVAFTVSFSTNKIPFILALFAHSLQVAWVEHVLYSQKEDNVYPAVLVPLTSAVGVLLASRLYKNETLGLHEAALIAASYIAKLLTFVVEVTGSYYLAESAESDKRYFHAIEIGLAWWSALFAGFVVVVFELKRGRHLRNTYARPLTALFVVSALAMTASTARNFQRAVFEFFTQTRLADSNSVHVILGTSFLFFSLVTYPFFARHAGLHTFMYPLRTMARGALALGVILLVTQPTRITEHGGEVEFDFVDEDVSRYCSVAGMMLLVAGRLIPMTSLHFSLRAVYWLLTTVLLSVGLAMYVLPVPTVYLFAGICGFVYFSLLTLDVAHYRKLSSNEGWVVYAVSVCFMIFSLIVTGRVDVRKYAGGSPLLMWEIYTTGRRRQLSVAGITSLFMAIVLKFRVCGKSLVPDALPLTSEVIEQVGLLVNYTTVIAVSALTTHNIWCNGSEPGLHVATSLFLLLLADDGVLFTGLERGHFRYFPVLVYLLGVLWLCLLYDAYAASQTVLGGVVQCLWSVFYALPVVPSHVSLLLLLWFGKRRGGTPTSGVLAFVALDMLCLLFSARKTLQWMAIVGVCGQSARLFEAQFWKKRLETVL
ncbi:uncharacterized protein Tco025E_01984 [Trypanosoma conorhini]|uniref:Transmembrane protein n=1 Tax=Trypanosoma conorhini TaxID=83891 RepID=A0A3R7N5J0_9TRYP|nr:uncharacterized protein Tco025E_01984 [Trypanosoma conorhini]RNF25744.1 hypothetical protein Tco025E_01984 [Trypanosoma conorhini]